jgi:hypothetical protein
MSSRSRGIAGNRVVRLLTGGCIIALSNERMVARRWSEGRACGTGSSPAFALSEWVLPSVRMIRINQGITFGTAAHERNEHCTRERVRGVFRDDRPGGFW